jgi:hypothetical protein
MIVNYDLNMFIVQATGKDEYDVILLSDLLPLSLSPPAPF